MDSCDPHQSLEPDQLLTEGEPDFSANPESSKKTPKRKFVPIHETRKKQKIETQFNGALQNINKEIERGQETTKQLLEFLKEDSRR